MIEYKSSQLSKKEANCLKMLALDLSDIYSDFYITKDNLRLFLRDNFELLIDAIKKGDKLAYDETSGVALLTGFSDNAPRKYLKILCNDLIVADKLVKVISSHNNTDMYIKIKQNNPIKSVLETNSFKFIGGRGKECLLCRKLR